MKRWTLSIFLTVLLAVWGFLPAGTAAAAAAPTLAPGSANGDVWDLQFRLHVLGFLPQGIDGVFGSRTERAVLRFQQQYGLRADGVVGPHTWRSLKRVSVNAQELNMLARVVYGEARGEPYKGQVAVAAVVLNRLSSPQFPHSVRGIVFQRGAFTAVSDGQYYLKPNATAYRAALDAAKGWDPTGGALYYFNPKTATSDWIWSRPQTVRIGNHIFAR